MSMKFLAHFDGNTNTDIGTLTNSASSPLTSGSYVSGKFGQAFSVLMDVAYCNTGTALTQWSVDFWAKPKNFGSSLANISFTYGTLQYLHLDIVALSDGFKHNSDPLPGDVNTFTHFAITYNGTSVSLLINGTFAKLIASGNYAGLTRFSFGAPMGSTAYFDEVRITDEAITENFTVPTAPYVYTAPITSAVSFGTGATVVAGVAQIAKGATVSVAVADSLFIDGLAGDTYAQNKSNWSKVRVTYKHAEKNAIKQINLMVNAGVVEQFNSKLFSEQARAGTWNPIKAQVFTRDAEVLNVAIESLGLPAILIQ